ncbi:MAG: GspH/FimT family pseudopilin [Alteromonadaceae bacterium]|nr:GspH/FimT family pseudopilin [Alteromonadaceae bacterium]
MKPKHSGFTLIELMIVVALIAIIAMVAVPGFSSLIESNRHKSTTNNVIGILNYARSEAVRRGEPVSVRATDGDLQNGLVVILESVDPDDDPNPNPLRQGDEMPGAVTLTDLCSNLPIVFRGTGEKLDSNISVLRISPGNGNPATDIVVNAGGQANRHQSQATCP